MMTRMHKFMYLVTTLTFALLAAGHRCPSDHPVAYNDGNHCCSSNKEKECGNLGKGCDGSFIGNGSRCCRGDEFVPCLQKPCENYRVCSTEECKKVSARLSENMNPEADPCDDFEKFACGKFIEEAVIPETLYSLHLSESDHTRTIFERTKTMLEKDPVEESPFQTDRLLRVHYKACMNLERIERESLPYAKRIMKYLGGFPAVEGASWDKHRNEFRWWDITSKLPRFGIRPSFILDFEYYPDPKNTKKMAMYLDQPSLGISGGDLENGLNDTDVQYYYEYMVEAAKIMGADNATAHEDMKEALLFEIGIAKIKDYLDEKSKYNKRTMRDLEGQPGYPPSVKSYINQIFFAAGVSRHFGDDDEIIVKNLEYAGKLSELLQRTSDRAIANYICWRVYDSFDRLLGNASRTVRETWLRKAQGIPSDPPRWARCGREVGIGWYEERLTPAIGSLYVRNFFSKKDKEKAEMIVNDIRKAYEHMLENNNWMDKRTKKNALDKLKAMGQNVGYPDAILKPEVLNKFFRRLELGDSLLHNSLEISRFWIQHYLESIKEPVDRHHFSWHQWVTIVSSLTIYWSNYIEFPAGGLQEFRYNPEMPMYMNYGAIGSAIGWQMSILFYGRGRNFDKDGNLNYWWNEETLAKYNKTAQCLIDQYGKYKSEQVGLHIDGRYTLTSNIADIAGAKIAYSAYKNYERLHGSEKPVVGHNYTPEQFFWISKAQFECAKYTDQALRNFIKWGYVPSKFKILGALSNDPNFAKDFNCPVGSKMNPTKRCDVW